VALTSQRDSYGNIWDDRGYWVGTGADYGKKFVNGEWVPDPNPPGVSAILAAGGDTDSGGGGITYETYTSDGSDGFRPGTILQRGSNGSVTVKYTPPAGSSGGGGSTSVTNTYISQNPGALYTDRISDGSDGYPPGTIIQTNNLTGAETVKYKPPVQSDPASLYNDRNGDGYDDQTGMPNGVTSFGGKLYYQGVEVNPDGSPKAPSAPEAPDYKTWTGQGPKGYGTYYLDGAGGTPGTFIGDTRAPSAAGGSSGGNNYSVSGTSLKFSSGGGGGGSGGGGYTVDPNIGARADAEMQVARMKADLEKEFFYAKLAAENDSNNLQNQIRLQQLNMQLQQMAQQEARLAAQERRGLINDFRSAVTDTDPSAMHSMLYAQGVGAGGNIVNRLAAGDNALSDQALSGAAALLQQLRVPPSSPMAQWVPQMGGLGGAPGAGGVPGTPTGGVPTVPGLPQTPEQQAAAAAAQNAEFAQSIQRQQAEGERTAYNAAAAKELADNAPGNWVQDRMQGNIPYYTNKVTGASLPVSDWFQFMDQVALATGAQTSGDRMLSGMNANEQTAFMNDGGRSMSFMNAMEAQAAPRPQTGTQLMAPGTQFNVGDTGSFGGKQFYYGPSGWGTTNQGPVNYVADPTTGGYKVAPGTTYSLADDQVQQGIDLPNKVVVPGLARGGMARGPMVVGENGPELVNAPMGASVTPISRPTMNRLLMNGLPGYANGTRLWDAYQAPDFNTGYVDTNTYSPTAISKPTYVQPTYTQPAPAQQPTYTQPAPAPITNTTAPTPAQPVSYGAPVQQTASTPQQPVSTTTAPVQQPVMTGLNTPSGVINTTGLTPEEQALLDEVRQVRESTPVPDLGGMSPYDVAFKNLARSSQEAFFKGTAARTGVRASDFEDEVWKNHAMMPGLSRGSMSTGY
jgi:hypothetical protein